MFPLLFALLLIITDSWNSSRGQLRSQVRKLRLFVILISVLLVTWFSFHIAARGEGCVVSMDYMRTAKAVKSHGSEPRLVSGPSNTQTVRKRSYIRALRRARRFGFTWYRDQLLTSNFANDCSNQPSTSPHPSSMPPSSTYRTKRSRMKIFSWNIGGLSPARWDLFQQWLQEQDLDFVSIQESHWPFSRSWTIQHFHVIHSGTSSNQAGLLCLVSKRFCTADQLAWQEIEPGRLLHVRIHGTHRNMDFLSIYQHVHSLDRMEQRQSLWDRLNQTLTDLPKRNFLTLLGDFNTSLPSRSLAVGLGTYLKHGRRVSGAGHRDSEVLHQIFRHHALHVLNTWTPSNGPTFEHGHNHSRIDFICCRRLHSDCTSRQAQPLTQFPLLSPAGAQHFPLVASLVRSWTPKSTSSPSGWSHKQRLALYAAYTSGAPVISDITSTLHDKLQGIPNSENFLDDLHQAMNHYSPTIFSPSTTTPVHQFNISPFQRFQYHSQALRHLDDPTLQSIFKAWFHVCHFVKARRQMNSTAKRARRAKLEDLFEQANEADQAKDHFRLYQAVRKIAPKTPHSSFQLRSNTGQIATAAEAADLLCDWYEHLYKAPLLPALVDISPDFSSTLDWPFSCSDLAQGFAVMPKMKALAPTFAPAPFWTLCADTLADILHPRLMEWFAHAALPQVWGKGHLKFLLKPGRSGGRPGDLRPIALLEPTGKLTMGLIAKKLLAGSWWLLRTIPQLAYLPHRSCSDAIHRILSHCNFVRSTLHSFRYKLQQAAAGVSPPPLFGGFLLSLDLSRAFDEVDRQKLFRALFEIGIDPDLISILHSVYSNSEFEFIYKGEHRSFRTHKGIRQGCKAAPILWNIYTADLITQLADLISWNFVVQHLTIYADDMCQHQHFASLAEFQTALQRAGHLMDVIENAGLPINTDKTVALCRFAGTQSNILNKRHIFRTKNGAFLCIPRSNQNTIKIKLVKECTYLGIKVSYGPFEKQTMQHRLHAGSNTQIILHKWLHLKTGLSPKQRIWKQCVFASMTHGLFACGFHVHDLILFYRQCLKQLRRIFREPVFITREAHSDFLRRHHLADPLELLRDQCRKAQRREDDRLAHAELDDILHFSPKIDHAHLLQVIDEAQRICQGDWKFSPVTSSCSSFSCPDCPNTFETMAALRRHRTIAHGTFRGAHRIVQPADMSHGLPTCKRCLTQFTTWQQFHHHVRYVCAHSLQDDDPEDHEHRLRVAEFLQFSNAANFQALRDQGELLSYFQSHCILCGQFHLSSKSMMHHWASSHPDVYAHHGPALETIQLMYKSCTPCDLCGQTFKRQHHCIILGQAAMSMTAHAPPTSTSQKSPTVLFTCDICSKAYVTRHGLRDHIMKYHQTLEAASTADFQTNAQLQDVFKQAVMDNDITTLLQNEQILSYLGTTCSLCTKSFSKRNTLTRHLRHHHASIWKLCETKIDTMNELHRPFGKCYCVPALSRVQHTCVIFQQFQMLRLAAFRPTDGQHGYAPGLAGATLPLGPAAVATPQQHAVALLFHGHVDQLYIRPDMRMVLTVHCMFCTQTFRSGDALMTHLAAVHREFWTISQETMEYFRWLFFSRSGCMCNPGPCPGDASHQCAPLKQLAMLFHDFGMPICIPFAYSAKDLVDLLTPLLTYPALQMVTRSLMLRQFAKLWQHRELGAVLKSTCLICQDTMELNQLQNHIEIAHGISLDRFSYHMRQLAQIFVAFQSDEFACDFCGASLQVAGYYGLNSQILQHLFRCPVILQFAVLFGHPTWDEPWTGTITWPDQDSVVLHHRKRTGRLWQLNVQTSAHPSLLIAQCGKEYIDDPIIRSTLSTTCLICGKFFISSWKFLQHLFDVHNFHQMDTEHCHNLLIELHNTSPCDLCGSAQHSKATGKRCVALFNLAVYLCNSYGLNRGRADGYEPGSQDLEAPVGIPCFEPDSDDQGRVHRRDSKRQKTEDCSGPRQRAGQGSEPIQAPHSRIIGRNHPALETTGSSARRLDQCSVDGGPVPDSLQHGRGLNSAGHVPSLEGLATTAGEDGPTSTSPGEGHDGHFAPTIDSVGQCGTDRCHQNGLRQVPPGECTGTNALFGMESTDQDVGTHEGQALGSPRNSSLHQQHHPSPGRASGHGPISLPEEIGRSSDPSSSMAMGGLNEEQSRTLARGQDSVLPLFLAVDYGTHQTTGTSEIQSRTTSQSGLMRHAIRILYNVNGCMCFANAALLGIAWVTILSDGLHDHMWLQGFELVQQLVQWTPVPLDLRNCLGLHNVLRGDVWGLKDLDKQQDLMDFLSYILSVMRPLFLHCGWQTRPEYISPSSDSLLCNEKGSAYLPVMLQLSDTMDPDISLQTLINLWHDAPGLCKAFEKAGTTKCFTIDRVSPETRIKCQHLLALDDFTVQLPHFGVDGDIIFHRYFVSAFVYHIGATINSGHYRCVICRNGIWYDYDDGALPTRYTVLPSVLQRQLMCVWLTVRNPNAATSVAAMDVPAEH